MSFFTALSLSFSNLRTKKGRTILTSFAGSIGIIGIALILALSTGMNSYIESVQKETMASYPITINSQAFDTSVFSRLRGQYGEGAKTDQNGVYADYSEVKVSETVVSGITQNNLTAFKKYLDDPASEIREYLGANGVVYGYDVTFSVYSYDEEGRLVDSDSDPEDTNSMMYSAGGGAASMGMFSSMMSNQSGTQNFSQMMTGANGEPVSQVVTDSYELLHGVWPTQYDEVVLVLDEDNSVPAKALYQLGLITGEKYRENVNTIKSGDEAEKLVIDYDTVCGHSFYLVAACDYYKETGKGTFSHIDDVILNRDALLENAVELKVTGVIRPVSGASNANISTAVAYTGMLTDHIIEHTADSPVVTAQEKTPDINVLNGMKFEAASDGEKVDMTAKYIREMSAQDKASLYKLLLYYGAASIPEGAGAAYASADGMAGDAGAAYAAGVGQMGAAAMDDNLMAAMLDSWLANDPDPEFMLMLYEQYIGNASYEDNMKQFGSVSYDTPSSISIYADDFESKEAITACISNYNRSVEENSRISYTDYVAMMTSSLTVIINGISFVLIAFVAVSLIVSCIMIGIITHISVLERTKEIGILRALGASKGNISQVFNAETFIIGCFSGLVGIGFALLLLVPINLIIRVVSGMAGLGAHLPFASALILIAISIAVTVVGGLLPAGKAAKKDPVIALRTE